jgi:leader peptidase (prepilin peptidase)/N-methyltransferase
MISLASLVVPLWLLQVMAFGFGIIIGSFLNVYIYRFHTGKSLAGHSHCLSCGAMLRWYELFPLVSYLALRGRCRTCGCRITPRYFAVELVTGLLFALALTLSLDVVTILFWWFIFSILVVVTVYDLYHFIIPDRLTAILVGMALLLGGYQFWLGEVSARWLWWGVLAALGGTFFFFLLWFISKGKWIGFGDVKLAFPLGLLVGPVYVFSFVVLSFWVGAAVSVAILGYGRWSRGKARLHLPGKALTMKSAVPFAPFLVASSLIILFTQFDVLALFSFA